MAKNNVKSEKVGQGCKVSVHYHGTLDNGEVFDSSKEREPLEFITGQKMVIAGFEDAVSGMAVGDKKTISIEPKEAYGEPIKELIQEVPKEAFGKEVPKAGATIGIRGPMGQVLPAKIVEVKGDKVTLDLNHPLAGKRLTFEIELVSAKKLSKKELDDIQKHAHSHSCSDCGDGHSHDHGCGGGCC